MENAKSYIQVLNLQQSHKDAQRVKEKEEDRAYMKLLSQRLGREDKQRQEHF